MLKRLPAWIRWSVLAAVTWSAWVLLVTPVFTRRIRETDQQHQETHRQSAELQAHLKQAPVLVLRSDSCRIQLVNRLAAFASTGRVDALVRHLRESGSHFNLTNLQVDPDLTSLLHRSGRSDEREGPSAKVDLDTLVVALTASGQFFGIGAWLDGLEARPDFRTWLSCRWTAGDDPARTTFEGRAMLLVASGQLAAEVK